MNQHDANQCAAHFITSFPQGIRVEVDVSAVREGQGYAVILTVPRRNRRLRLVRSKEIEGAFDLCSVLLSEKEEHTSL